MHTKNPARVLDTFDHEALEKCKGTKKPWEFINNYKQVKYYPQDYRKYIVENSSIALFYTTTSPVTTGKLVVGYAVISKKNDDFITYGNQGCNITNKSNAGNYWGEEWCLLLSNETRFRFPFQELIDVNERELAEELARDLLKVKGTDDLYFKNLSMFIPNQILIKYLSKLKSAIDTLQIKGSGKANLTQLLSQLPHKSKELDELIQKLKSDFLSFKYPGLPAVGRFLLWWNAYSCYEELRKEYSDDEIKSALFKAVYNTKFRIPIKFPKDLEEETKNRIKSCLYLGSRKRGMHPLKELPERFIKFLENTLIYWPISNDEVIKQIKILLDEDVIRYEDIENNPYMIYEKFVPPINSTTTLNFEDVDYGEYNKFRETCTKEEANAENFFLNPYRIRALIHEFFKLIKEDPGYVWLSFKDVENYVKSRLLSGPRETDFNLQFQLNKILQTSEVQETIEIDWENGFLTTKELKDYEEYVEKEIKNLLNQKNNLIKLAEKFLTKKEERNSIEEKGIENYLSTIVEDSIKKEIDLSTPDKEDLKSVILKLLENRFSFLSGVAGSGKSTIVTILTDVLRKLGEDVTILTPTGKASERLNREGRVAAKTIHLFLKENGFINNKLFTFNVKGSQQKVENLIIDEISMVSLELLYYLLNAVDLKSIKRLIFVGDIKQLPPIGYGYPARDLYSYLKRERQENLIELKKCYRSEDVFIQLANKLREKNLTREDIEEHMSVIDKLTEEASPRVDNKNFLILKFSSRGELEDLLKRILDIEKVSKDSLGKNPESFQVLTPKKEGFAGTDYLNLYILNLLNKKSFERKKSIWVNTKIIKLTNTYCKNEERCTETFNGMIGVVKRAGNGKLEVEFGGGKKIHFNPEKLGYEYDYAYAITVHKSQGSEFDTVVLILPKDIGSLFTRELLYTGLTRARRKLYLLVEDEDMLTETPKEVERSGKLFGENLLELPEKSTYISIEGKNIFSKLELYIAALLESKGISYRYRTLNADFEIEQLGKYVHLLNLLKREDRLKEQTIPKGEGNIVLSYPKKNYIDVKELVEKLGISYKNKSSQNKEDYRERVRKEIEEEYGVHVEPDTNYSIIAHNGIITRSLSEAILMVMFDKLELDYEYERELELEGNKFLPDFSFREGKVLWEHLGMLNNEYYLEKWKEKKEKYENAGIRVVHLREWNGEENSCIFTTEEDIANLKLLKEALEKVALHLV